MWLEWQKYDSQMHISMMQANPDALSTSSLNVARLQIFSNMVSRQGNGLKIVDIGCGDGVVSEPIVKMGNYVASVELPEIAAIAQKCGASSVVAGDAENLAFASNSVDVVLASEVVEHLWNPQEFLDEAHRILRINGYLIIETPEGEGSLYYDSHKHYFTVEILTHMLKEGFSLLEVKRLKPTGNAQTPTIIVLFSKSA